MGNWIYTVMGADLRQAIDCCLCDLVITEMIKVCDDVIANVTDEDVIYDWKEFKEELQDLDRENLDEDETDYYLDDLYNLADNTNIFIGL